MARWDVERLLLTGMQRRRLLIGVSALTSLAIASQFSRRVVAQPRFSDYPFKLGVTSGEPLPDGFVIWTRLAPQPLNGGGMPKQNIEVRWQVARDPKMQQVVQQGKAIATPELAHSVHVEVQGLEPNRWYWYQFKAGNDTSRIGRTRTAPARGDRLQQLTFAFASCQDWQNGFYSAYRNMAREELDFVVHLGDYIYEYGPDFSKPRQHNSPEIISLVDYRNRHALYKTGFHLQAVHAKFPWIVTWDDHEVDNNYANLIPEDDQTREEFIKRRANAYQAYYEHMPLRLSSLPKGSDMQLYRRLTFGDLAEFFVLDTRQYRSDQPCGDGLKPRCAEALAEKATMTGKEQERWLFKGLERSPARWNVIAQQTMMAQFDFDARSDSETFNLDQWDGYVAARDRLFHFIQQRKVANPVAITGDIHSSWVHDLKADFNNPASPTIGTEFVGTSITSDFPAQFIAPVTAALADNPHTQFFDGAFRGYVRCQLTPKQWRSDYRVVSSILDPQAPASTLASFIVENGQPGAQNA
ncbi:alkaline phosphatase [Gloeocapsa sp. BRSZ]